MNIKTSIRVAGHSEKDKLFKVLMAFSDGERSVITSNLANAVFRAWRRTYGRKLDVPKIMTGKMIKQAVQIATKKQLAADLRYCQTEGVDVAAFIKAKYKVA